MKLKESQESLIHTLLAERIREFVRNGTKIEFCEDKPQISYDSDKLEKSVDSIIDFIKKYVW